MPNLLVAGLVNIETTLRIDAFPIAYEPVRYPFFGVHSTVSGVGANVALALTALGSGVHFLSLVGNDLNGHVALHGLHARGLATGRIRPLLQGTPQSVILYDATGRRQVNVDLKDVQDAQYPLPLFDAALEESELAVLCNVNFSRPLLERARRAGIAIATDVHTLSDIHDPYNADFMRAANILFLSNEHIPGPEAFITELAAAYANDIIVMGLGAQGALLYDRARSTTEHIPAIKTREVVNTIGAGDALFAAFLHFYTREGNAPAALRRAMLFASHKIGEKGAAEGFLTEAQLLTLYAGKWS